MATTSSKNGSQKSEFRDDHTSKRVLILHPLLFALFPILTLVSTNIQEMKVFDANRSIVISAIFTGLLLLVLQILSHDWHKAAALSSLYIIFFFSYGHSYTLLRTMDIHGLLIGRHRFLISAWIVILIIGSWVIFTRIRDFPSVTRMLNIFSAILIMLPVISILAYLLPSKVDLKSDQAIEKEDLIEGVAELNMPLPDIYYIIPDAYIRNDILRDQFDYDNTHFIDYLENRGFYVATQSNSNYLWTRVSLASSLNLDYLQNFAPEISSIGEQIYENEFIKHSLVRKQLENLGYTTIAFDTGFLGTELFDAEYFLTPDKARLNREAFNAFEVMLIHTSAGRILVDLDRITNIPFVRSITIRMESPFYAQRETILSLFENLKNTPNIPGPKFVFAHITSPHKPYVFGPNGEVINPEGPFTLADTDELPVSEESRRYVDQLIFITTMLQEAIDIILNNSDQPPIIVLQSDHGFSANLRWPDIEEDALRARMSILNAYYLPIPCQQDLYSSITPVNSFRVVFNCAFNASYEFLDDVTYLGYQRFTPVDEILK